MIMEKEELKKAIEKSADEIIKVILDAPKKKEDKLKAAKLKAEKYFKKIEDGEKVVKI